MNDYKIKLTGLKDGNYSNSFKIRDEFFEAFEKSEIKFIDIKADTLLEINQKKMSVEISLDGVYKDVQCDICTEKIDVPLSLKTNYIIQKGLESTFFDDNIIYIDENEKNINLTNVFYDMIVLAFPTKRQHKLNSTNDDECNKEMINLINKYSIKEQKEIDPRWEALKNIKLK